MILVAGILRVRGLLYRPFLVRGEPVGIVADEAFDPTLDTDKDGLPDASELQIGTSPYLADTDSDGVSDGEEVKNNTDPLCPQGKECATKSSEPTSVDNSAQNLLGPTGAVNPGSLGNLLGITGGTGLDNITPAQARASLKTAGVTPALLDQLDDATVLDLYKKTAASAGATPEQIVTADPVKSMSPAELRTLLIRSGIDPKKIEKLTDEQLVQLVEETLQNKK